MKIRSAVYSIAVLLLLFVARIATAQTLHVTYVCTGQRMFIENCNSVTSLTPPRAWSAIPRPSDLMDS